MLWQKLGLGEAGGAVVRTELHFVEWYGLYDHEAVIEMGVSSDVFL